MVQKIKLAMLDWNGTLFDDVRAAHEGVIRIFRHFCLTPPSLSEYRNGITPDLLTFYYERGVPRNVDLLTLRKIYKTAIEDWWDRVEFSKYAISLLRCLKAKKIPMVLITMESEEIITRRLTQLKLYDEFADVLPGISKKEEVIRRVLEQHGVKDSREAFYAGDTVGDVEAAKAAGVFAIACVGDHAYYSKERLEAAKPDLLAESLWDIVLWLCQDDQYIDIGW